MTDAIHGGQLELLGDDQVAEIHDAACTVLEEKGLMVESEAALDLLEENGADVDREENLVTIPQSLVEDAVETAPSSFTLAGRNRDNDVTIGPDKSVFSTGTGVTSIRDLETGERRKPETGDISDAVRLSDALPNIDVSWGFFTMRDDPMLGFHNLYRLLSENTKHGGIVNWYGGELTRKLIEMIDVVSDGPVGDRPLVTMYSEPVSPLSFRRENMESILQWTDAGLPLIWYPAQKPGATAPVTLAGTFAQALAETLGGNVIAQLNNPGTPVIIGVSPLVMNLQKGINVYFSPEMLILQSASGQFADFYDIPVFGTGGCTNAYSLEFQAGLESAVSLYGAVLGGQNFIHDLGFAGRGDVGSMELLTLADEMIGMVKRAADGMTVNADTLAVDVIKEVDHGGNFLSANHTKRFGRDELFLPELLDAVEGSQWTENKAREKASERTKNLLEEAEPDPLDAAVVDQLDAKMDEATQLAEELDRL